MLKNTNDPHLDMIRNKFFRESILGVAIFGVPAFTALALGRYLDRSYNQKYTFTFILLIVAFVSSWVIIYFRTKRINKEYTEFRALQKKSLSDKEKEDNTDHLPS